MIRAFFLQVYPFEAKVSARLSTNILAGIFVALFLIVFEPFQTDQWDNPAKTVLLAGYGAVTTLILVILDGILYWMPGYRHLEMIWTVWWEVLHKLTVLLLIALGNMLYAHQIGISHFSLYAYWNWTSLVLMVGFFPILGLVLLKYSYYKALNQQTAARMSESLQGLTRRESVEINLDEITLMAENEKSHLSLRLDDLWYIESADNYVIILHRDTDRLRRSILRGSLKRFEQQLGHIQTVIRCHRSYLVNLRQVETITGNAQGYRLLLREFGVEVPVARQYGPAVLAKLQEMHAKRP